MTTTDPEQPPPSALPDLATTAATLRAALTVPDAASLSRRPTPEAWAIWDIAYHVAQIEVWYVAKLCEAANVAPVEAMARFLDAWSALRREAVAVAAAVPPERMDQLGLLSGVPDWTPRFLVEQIAAHDREHTAQAWAARGGQSSATQQETT